MVRGQPLTDAGCYMHELRHQEVPGFMCMQRKELKSCRVMVEKGAASQPFVYFNHRHVFNDQSTPAPPPFTMQGRLLCRGGGGGSHG